MKLAEKRDTFWHLRRVSKGTKNQQKCYACEQVRVEQRWRGRVRWEMRTKLIVLTNLKSFKSSRKEGIDCFLEFTIKDERVRQGREEGGGFNSGLRFNMAQLQA